MLGDLCLSTFVLALSVEVMQGGADVKAINRSLGVRDRGATETSTLRVYSRLPTRDDVQRRSVTSLELLGMLCRPAGPRLLTMGVAGVCMGLAIVPLQSPMNLHE